MNRKRGMAIVIPLIFLMILALLAYVVNKTTNTELKQTYRSADNYRAMLLCEGLIADAEAEIRHKANNEFRDTFINGGTLSLAETQNGDKTKALLTELRYVNDTSKDRGHPAGIGDIEVKATVWGDTAITGTKDDKLKKLTIEASIDFVEITKKLKVTYDVKVVDCSPPAKQYVFYVEQTSSDTFNNKGSGAFYVNDGALSATDSQSEKSKGIALGGSPVINIHSKYEYSDYWGDTKNDDLHFSEEKYADRDSVSKNGSSKSLISDNSSGFGSTKLTGNHPWHMRNLSSCNKFEDFNSGNQGQRGKDLVATTGAPSWHQCNVTSASYQAVENRIFYSGVSESWTHLFGHNVRCPTDIFGSVKKKVSKWQYQSSDMTHSHISGCDTSSDSGQAGQTGTLDPKDTISLSNQGAQEFDYKTSESNLQGKSDTLDSSLNFKDDFLKAATRNLKKLQWNDTTLNASSGYLMLEGILYCESVNAINTTKKIGTPSMLVVKNSSSLNSDYICDFNKSAGHAGGTFFKSKAFFTHVQLNGTFDTKGKTVKASVAINESAQLKGNLKLTGNLSLKKLTQKDFSGDVFFRKSIHEIYKPDSDGKVVTISPIPCQWVDLQNK